MSGPPISLVLGPRREGERAKSGAGAAPDLERRHDEQELVDARLGQLFEEKVLDDVDPVVSDDQHVHGEHLERRRPRGPEDRGALLEGERVVADDAGAGIDQELRALHARTGREVALVERWIRAEVLSPSRPDEDGVAAFQLDLLGLGGASEMEYVGLTLAIGECSSQTDARSKSRAFCTFRMNSRTRPAPWDGSPAVAESTLPAATRPAARSAALRTKSRRATERGPSCALRLSCGMGFLPPGL